MPFKSEKQRKYLWANEPEIARDWTKTYGSKVKKAEGGIMQDGYVNFTKGSDSVTIPKKFKARKDATPTHLAYITKAEAAQLKKQNKGTPHKGPKGIPSYDDYDAKTGSYSTGAEMSAAETGGSGHGMSESRARDIRRGAQAAAKASERQTKSKIDNFRQNSINSFVNRNKYKNLINAGVYKGYPGITAKILGLMNPPDEVGMFDEDDIKTLYAGGANPKGLAGLRKDFEFEEKFKNVDPTQKQFEDYYGLNQPITGGGGEGGGNPYIYPTTSVASAAESSGQSDFDKYLAGLGGDYQVPIEYVQNQTRAAEGGRIGYADAGSVLSEEQNAMVVNMLNKGMDNDTISTITGVTPQQIKVILDSFLQEAKAQGGRIPAAFGGVMDSYTGRRAYGLGSIFKKITKAPKKAFKSIKKLAKSPLGKLALGYLATAGIGNIMQPGAAQWGSPLGKGSGWLRPSQVLKNYGLNQGANTTAALTNAQKAKIGSSMRDKGNLLTRGLKWGLDNPMASILGASTAAGLMAKKPIEEVGGIDKKWGKDKEWWDAYYANMPEEGDFRVEDEYILSAKGGRVAKNQGGLMNLGGLEKDYRNTGGFVDIGGKEKADDVPARLSRNEFVMTADAVRGAGGGDIDKGAALMDRTMKNLEAKGKGAKDMYQTATRLSEVI